MPGGPCRSANPLVYLLIAQAGEINIKRFLVLNGWQLACFVPEHTDFEPHAVVSYPFLSICIISFHGYSRVQVAFTGSETIPRICRLCAKVKRDHG